MATHIAFDEVPAKPETPPYGRESKPVFVPVARAPIVRDDPGGRPFVVQLQFENSVILVIGEPLSVMEDFGRAKKEGEIFILSKDFAPDIEKKFADAAKNTVRRRNATQIAVDEFLRTHERWRAGCSPMNQTAALKL